MLRHIVPLCLSSVIIRVTLDMAGIILTAAGLGPAYNILDGFEGGHDADGHRTVSGWKNAGLPWRQG